MKLVKFTCPRKGGKYPGGLVEFIDGQTKEVPDDEADRLVKDFPGQFVIVGEQNTEEVKLADNSMNKLGKRGRTK